MAHYDAIFKNGTIVNQDGIHAADIGVRGGLIAALGARSTDTADSEPVARSSLCSSPGSRKCT